MEESLGEEKEVVGAETEEGSGREASSGFIMGRGGAAEAGAGRERSLALPAGSFTQGGRWLGAAAGWSEAGLAHIGCLSHAPSGTPPRRAG